MRQVWVEREQVQPDKGLMEQMGDAIAEVVEEGVNMAERVTGWDIDGDGDVGLAGHDNAGLAEAGQPEERRRPSKEEEAAPDETGHAGTQVAAGTHAAGTARSRSARGVRKGSSGLTSRELADLKKSGAYIDAPTRQRHLQLWATRQAADKMLARRAAEPAGKNAMPRAPVSFHHELSADKYGFAFGGVDPGTLHAHGKLVKVHSVHYSIGLAGAYKLHVGLRQQMVKLPGSPFSLFVEPGAAYAASSRLPKESLPLAGVADEEWQHGLIFTTADMLGNACIKGGADVVMKLSDKGSKLAADAKASSEAEGGPLQCKVTDKEDGTYELLWKSHLCGTYSIDVLISNAHVAGSPFEVSVTSAKPAVERMVVSGLGVSRAVAGDHAQVNICILDRFDNIFNVRQSAFTYSFGLILAQREDLMAAKTANKKNKDSKAAAATATDKTDKARDIAKSDARTAVSMPFEVSRAPRPLEISPPCALATTAAAHDAPSYFF